MSYNSPEIPVDFRAMTHRLDDARQQGHISGQLHDAGIVQQGWLARQGHRVLYHVGHLLITVGERLEQNVVPTPSV